MSDEDDSTEGASQAIVFVPEFFKLTPEEQLAYLTKVGERVLAHRYRYYVQDQPMLADFEYDYLERYYEALAAHLGQPNTFSNMVGYNHDIPGAREIAAAVEAGMDDYGVWLEEMQAIWDRIGQPRYRKEAVKAESAERIDS